MFDLSSNDHTMVIDTLEKAVDYIVTVLCENDTVQAAKWMELDEEEASTQAHHGLGQAIRNAWGLWHGSDLAVHIHERFGLTHADDMSDMIIRCAHRKMTNKELNPEEIGESFKKYWSENGGMPQPCWVEGLSDV